MSRSKELLRNEYIGRINKAIDYINNNLSSELNLEKIASVAAFSKFHFHRIFSSVVGETVSSFIRRRRLDKAAMMLAMNPKDSVAEIAYSCGFSSPSLFSRTFKEHFGISPIEFREKPIDEIDPEISKESQSDSNFEQLPKTRFGYIADENYLQLLKLMKELEMEVSILELPEQKVLYVRHKGNYSQIGEAFDKLMKWAGPRGLLQMPKTQIYGVYYDSPNLTDEDKLTSDACITIDEDVKVDGEIGIGKIKAGKYACAHFRVSQTEFAAAWNKVFSEWLPDSGYQPDDKPSFEHYLNDPEQDPEGKYEVNICIPVKPL